MQKLMENWPAIVAIVGAALVLAKLIVKLTPSTKDDEIVDKAEKVVETVEKIVPPSNTPKA